MLGVIGLAGVVVNDSLVMVDHLNELRSISPKANLIEVIAKGGADRFRAIVMTTLTTVAGVAPTVYGSDGTLTRLWSRVCYPTDSYPGPMLIYGIC